MQGTVPIPVRLGLTGGIGSGESTAAALLAEEGAAAVIDADAISRTVTAAGGSAISAIRQTFGAHVIDSTGALDRAVMRELVCADPGARQQLEAIIHPIVMQESWRHAQQAQQQGNRLLIFDVPLLVESGGLWRAQLDCVAIVDCEREEQIARVAARSGWPRAHIEVVLAAQAGRERRLAAADAVIDNGAGATLEQLRTQTRALRRALLEL